MRTYLKLFLLGLLILSSQIIKAQSLTSLNELQFVSDIDNVLPGISGTINNSDDSIISLNILTNESTNNNDLGVLPSTGIDAFHRTGDGCGDSLYSIDSTALISSVVMLPADVFTSSGNKTLDSRAAGIPAGTNVDAASRVPNNCDLVISIDNTVLLNGTVYKANDLIRWNSVDGFSLFQSIALVKNIDAVHVLSSSRLLISTDVDSALSSIDIKDSEVVEVGIGNTLEFLSLSTETLDSSWQAVDISALWALPTPIEDLIFNNGFE